MRMYTFAKIKDGTKDLKRFRKDNKNPHRSGRTDPGPFQSEWETCTLMSFDGPDGPCNL